MWITLGIFLHVALVMWLMFTQLKSVVLEYFPIILFFLILNCLVTPKSSHCFESRMYVEHT